MTTIAQEPTAVVLPEKWERLCGILEGVEDKTDDRFNYIIHKEKPTYDWQIHAQQGSTKQ